jgi:hypothetical protein
MIYPYFYLLPGPQYHMIPLKWLLFSGGATIKHGNLPANHTATPETIHRRVLGRDFMEFLYPQKRVMERQTWGGLTVTRE